MKNQIEISKDGYHIAYAQEHPAGVMVRVISLMGPKSSSITFIPGVHLDGCEIVAGAKKVIAVTPMPTKAVKPEAPAKGKKFGKKGKPAPDGA